MSCQHCRNNPPETNAQRHALERLREAARLSRLSRIVPFRPAPTPEMRVLMESTYVWRQDMIADATAGL